jgi:short-subunit dehydrogenase
MLQRNGHRRPEVVVITGASAGVGRATARAFARSGAHVGLVARGSEGLEGAKRDVEALGGRAVVFPADVADADQVEAAARAVERAFGPIDIWINNAMTSVFGPFVEMTADEFRRVTEVTYLGYVHGTRAALKRMVPRNRGVVVQVGSALAYRGIPLQSAYCGAKHAVEGFTESVRCELMHDHSRVHLTMVQLPALNTPQFNWCKSYLPKKSQPVPPIYEPEVAAKAIVWAAHHHRREIFVGFSAAKAIIGNKIVPGVGDWYLARTGFESQMRDEPADPDRPSNLWEPVPGDFGAHGDFGHRAKGRSWYLWATTHRRLLGLAALAGAGLIGAAAAGLRRAGESRRLW